MGVLCWCPNINSRNQNLPTLQIIFLKMTVFFSVECYRQTLVLIISAAHSPQNCSGWGLIRPCVWCVAWEMTTHLKGWRHICHPLHFPKQRSQTSCQTFQHKWIWRKRNRNIFWYLTLFSFTRIIPLQKLKFYANPTFHNISSLQGCVNWKFNKKWCRLLWKACCQKNPHLKYKDTQ